MIGVLVILEIVKLARMVTVVVGMVRVVVLETEETVLILVGDNSEGGAGLAWYWWSKTGG